MVLLWPRIAYSTLAALFWFPWRLAAAFSTVPLIILISLAITVRTVNQDVVYPSVRVAGAPVGGMTLPEARIALAEATANLLQDPIILRSGDQTWRRTFLALGVGSDDATVEAALEEAWKVGHRATWREWWSDLVTLARVGASFPPKYVIDRERARATIETIVPAIERDPVDAEIVLVQAGDGYEVHLTPATTGVRVDLDATIDTLAASVTVKGPAIVDIATRVTQATVSTEALRAATAAASALVDDPIELVDPEDPRRRVVLDAPTAHAMLELGRSRGGVVTSARVDPVALRVWVTDVAKTITRVATNPRVALDEGKLIVLPGVPGRRLDVEATALAIEAKLAGDGHAADMIVQTDAPWVPIEAVKEARAQVEMALREPVILVIPVDSSTRKIRVESDTLLAWVALPNTLSIPRDTSQLAPPNRPILSWGVDPDAFGDYVQREILPLVSASATEPRVAVIARPDPSSPPSAAPGRMQTPSSGASTAIALATAIAGPKGSPTVTATQAASATFTVKPTATTLGVGTPPEAPTSTPTVPFRLEAVVLPGRPGRTVDVDGLRRAVDARLHEDLAPLTGVLVVPPTSTNAATERPIVSAGTPGRTVTATATPSSTSTVTRTRTATVTPTAISSRASSVSFGTPTAIPSSDAPFTASRIPTATRERSVTVDVIDQPAIGDTAQLVKVARTANVLIGAPIIVEWSNREWRVEPNDLVDFLRFGPVEGGIDAYLSREGLFAVAERIGRDAVGMNDAPLDAAGVVLPVDVPRTAAAIWAAANREVGDRRAEIAWIEDDPTPIPGVSTPRAGPPTATRTPIRNPAGRDATPTPTPTKRP